jgi:hypothetical protein
VWLVAVLASGGSALWSSLMGYTSAVKDARKQRITNSGVALTHKYMLNSDVHVRELFHIAL